jgi:hypothetical protein
MLADQTKDFRAVGRDQGRFVTIREPSKIVRDPVCRDWMPQEVQQRDDLRDILDAGLADVHRLSSA